MAVKQEWDFGGRRVRRIWPVPGVQALARAREVARGYREAAKQLEQLLGEHGVASASVAGLDRQYAEWGEDWHLDPGQRITFIYDDDEWIPTKYAGEVLAETGVAFDSDFGGANWLSKIRVRGGIRGLFLGPKQGFVFRVADIRELRTRMGSKGWRRATADLD